MTSPMVVAPLGVTSLLLGVMAGIVTDTEAPAYQPRERPLISVTDTPRPVGSTATKTQTVESSAKSPAKASNGKSKGESRGKGKGNGKGKDRDD